MSDPIADLVSSLATLGAARSTWWAFELLNHTSFGPEQKRPTAEQVEQRCTQLLDDNVLNHWSDEVIANWKTACGGPGLNPEANRSQTSRGVCETRNLKRLPKFPG